MWTVPLAPMLANFWLGSAVGPLGGGRKGGAELGFSIYSGVFALDWM